MATQSRLLRELAAFNKDPNPALESLEPSTEGDLMNLTAVMRGPSGSPYEGMLHFISYESV